MKNINFLLIFYFLNYSFLYSQEIDKNIKNTLIEFLISDNQYTENEITKLPSNVNSRGGILFNIEGIELNCNMNIKLFKFYSSSNKSKVYLLLLKNEKEHLILGKNLSQELSENLIYEFVKFFDDDMKICFYENIMPILLTNVYKKNLNITPDFLIKYFN